MTVTTLLIARHGNTFLPDEPPRRVGARTDLPLVPSGVDQARKLGAYLHDHNLEPDTVYCSALQRTQHTATLAAQNRTTVVDPVFNEIDYGIDENQPEDQVRIRLGDDVMHAWEQDGLMPPGWSPSPQVIHKHWADFADALPQGSKTLVVTSNGIARFALYLTGDWEQARTQYGLKLATGALGILTRREEDVFWTVAGWNIRP